MNKPKRKKSLIVFISSLLLLASSKAEDSLPHFTGFRSIVSMPDPTSVSNGYVDKKPGVANSYYRIYYVNPGGRYIFTVAQKAFKDSLLNIRSVPTTSSANESDETNNVSGMRGLSPDKALKIKRETATVIQISGKIEDNINENVFSPSGLIFTNIEGNLIIALPDANKKKFTLRVFMEDGTPIFHMKNIKEPQLLIDRSNFLHSGWFKYDLYENEKLREQNKFFIPPEGK